MYIDVNRATGEEAYHLTFGFKLRLMTSKLFMSVLILGFLTMLGPRHRGKKMYVRVTGLV